MISHMLEVRSICKSYHGKLVLHPTSFVLAQGQCLGIAGDNGSGKSTLLRLLAQIQRPDSGDILFSGKSVLGNKQFLRQNLGYVPQSNELALNLTVTQQLSLWQSACGLPGPLPKDILELLGLEPLLPKSIQDLSGGMQRRVSIAMALLSKPSILVMDEVTSGLDKLYVTNLLEWLETFLHNQGILIWCSHHAEEFTRLCGSVLYLKDGYPSF